jgi:hypothetical protein
MERDFARREAAARKRRIILNNDGNEPVYLAKEPTAEAILAPRTAALPGSQVDTVFYCSWSSGFSVFTHLTAVGQVFTSTEAMFAENRMPELARRGVDPLRVVTEFCHGHGIEAFWSMRMNDTHDGSTADYGPVMLRANRLKNEHPEWLVGSPEDRPRYGAWSAVDYGVPEIRELAYRFVEEVCLHYDVDGVELDFFRHPVFFRGPAHGFPCGEQERGLMTDLVRRIRAMMDERGGARGRPLLLAVRAPDSVSYCRKVGLDLERWLAVGLVDLLVPSGYIQLNPWQYSVALGHRYGVPVYPALDESRVREEGELDVTHGVMTRPRGTVEAYRARAATVWSAGADGVYLYNYFDPKSPMLRDLGDPLTLEGKDKLYFASYRGVGRVAGDSLPHEAEIALPTLNPQSPLSLYPGVVESVTIRLAETGEPELALRLKLSRAVAAAELEVRWNGRVVPARAREAGWLEAPIDPREARLGENVVEVGRAAESTGGILLLQDLQVRSRHGRGR